MRLASRFRFGCGLPNQMCFVARWRILHPLDLWSDSSSSIFSLQKEHASRIRPSMCTGHTRRSREPAETSTTEHAQSHFL